MKTINLLKIELYKVKHHRLSKILLIAYFILLTSIALIASINFTLGHKKISLAEQGIFNFPYIWHFNTYIADFFTFFLAIIIVAMVTNEYSYRTLKQNLIDGLSKKEFILSKFYFIVALALIATLLVFVISIILGFVYSDYTSSGLVFSQMYFLFAFFLKILGMFSLILFAGILLKRSAFALGFIFIWIIFEKIIYAILRWELFDKEIAYKVSAFFPYTSIQNLLPEPWSRLSAVKQVSKQIGENIDKFDGIGIMPFLIVMAWIIVLNYLSFRILERRDL